jgi:hypothetical protein
MSPEYTALAALACLIGEAILDLPDADVVADEIPMATEDLMPHHVFVEVYRDRLV